MAIGTATPLSPAALSQELDKKQVHCYKCRPPLLALLLWNCLVGCGYQVLVYSPVTFINTNTINFVLAAIGAFGFLGIMQTLYPIGGLLADIYYGRYKVTVCSITTIWCGAILVEISALVYYSSRTTYNLLLPLALLFLIIGFSGFKSNSVQFSLDQIQDTSSEKISLFLYWFVWVKQVGEMTTITILFTPILDKNTRSIILNTYDGVWISVGMLGLLLVYLVRRSFYHEKISSNPYRSVWKVVKFAARHGKPLGQRSAFTYSDHIKPTRMDFAKRIYGGPFTTEVVENVKTFIRIIIFLLAATPVFLLEVPTTYLLPQLGFYLGKNTTTHIFSYKWILSESGILSFIVPVVAIPVHLLVIRPYIKKWLPRMIVRLGIGIVVKVASVVSMLAIQTMANYTAQQNPSTNTTCFLLHNFFKHKEDRPGLQFPTEVLVVPNILNGVAGPLITMTALEFISAQSPHAMKGLLLGVFYAFRGLFLTLGSVAALPFALESLWDSQHGMLDCGFYYYLSNSVFGVLGLVVFILAARWYRYRERDDPPYRHQYAEDYYSHYEDYKQADYGTIAS